MWSSRSRRSVSVPARLCVPNRRRLVASALATATVAVAVPRATAQNTATWQGSSGGAWLTAGNWLGGVPGTGSIALVNNSSTSVGINMNGATNNGANNQAVGAVVWGSDATGGSFTLGNSSTTANGVLTLNGAGGVIL